MEFAKLKAAQDELNAKRDALAGIFTEAGPDLDFDKIKSLPGDSAAKVDEIRKRNEEINDLKDKVDELLELKKIAENARDDAREPGSVADPESKTGYKTLGELFTGSAAFKGYQPGAGIGPVATVEAGLKTLFETGAGWAPESVRTGRVEYFATRPAPHVTDAIPQTTTGQAAVPYMEETTFTNNAAERAEGVAFPEAALVLTEKSVTVRKIPVFLPVTDEQFEDEPRARAYVDNRLPFMIWQRLDLQALQGDGVAPNLLGTENVVGIQTQALGVDPLFDASYKLFRKIRDDGFAEPSAFFITPAKWESVRLARTADGIYILGSPDQAGPVRLWGVPGIETTAAPAAKLVAGDYRNFSELAVRRGIDIQVSNSHGSFFVEGKLAVRADIRVALIHYRPKAFGVVTGL